MNEGNWVFSYQGHVIHEGSFNECWKKALRECGKMTLEKFEADGYTLRREA